MIFYSLQSYPMWLSYFQVRETLWCSDRPLVWPSFALLPQWVHQPQLEILFYQSTFQLLEANRAQLQEFAVTLHTDADIARLLGFLWNCVRTTIQPNIQSKHVCRYRPNLCIIIKAEIYYQINTISLYVLPCQHAPTVSLVPSPATGCKGQSSMISEFSLTVVQWSPSTYRSTLGNWTLTA